LGTALIFWVALSAGLVYLPVGFQRRFSLGLSIPLGFLAAYGYWKGFHPWLKRNQKVNGRRILRAIYARHWILPVLWLVFSSLSSLYLSIGGGILASLRPSRLFDHVDVLRAVDWIEGQAQPLDAVFGAERTGLVVPARVGLRTYIGHPMETVDYERKLKTISAFYSPEDMSPEQRGQILLACHCDWVVIGPYERQLGGLDHEDLGNLHLAYKNSSVEVYRVRP
jgi:hypothetical protein